MLPCPARSNTCQTNRPNTWLNPNDTAGPAPERRHEARTAPGGQRAGRARAVGRLEGTAEAAGPLTPGPQIYQSIGVEPIINCRGTFTIIGGSVERPEVRAAMDAASRYFVQIDELADGVGQRLAELTGAEWGMVSSGCAAGMKHVTAACVTGGNPERLVRIPDLTGFDKTEVIIPRTSRNDYDAAIANIGVTIVTVNTLEGARGVHQAEDGDDLPAGRRAELGEMQLEAIAAIAKPRNVPIFVDAAAEILTIPNVHLQKGATIVAYSGGKAICGPQCAGLLLGDKDLLMAAWQASAPHHGPGPRQQGRPRGAPGDAGRGGGVGQARPRGRVEDVAVVARQHLEEGDVDSRRDGRGPRAPGPGQPQPLAGHLVGPGEAERHRRGPGRRAGPDQAANRGGRRRRPARRARLRRRRPSPSPPG